MFPTPVHVVGDVVPGRVVGQCNLEGENGVLTDYWILDGQPGWPYQDILCDVANAPADLRRGEHVVGTVADIDRASNGGLGLFVTGLIRRPERQCGRPPAQAHARQGPVVAGDTAENPLLIP